MPLPFFLSQFALKAVDTDHPYGVLNGEVTTMDTPKKDDTLTRQQVAEMAGMLPRPFQQMGSSRKPPVQEDGTYLRSDVEVWLAKRLNKKSPKHSVALAPIPPAPAPREEAPIIVLPKTHDPRGRLIDNEDEHVLNERLNGRGVNVKVLNKVIADMTTDINSTSRTLESLKKNVADLERTLLLKRASHRQYQETRDGLLQEAAGISDDLDDKLMETIMEVDAEIAAEPKARFRG